MATVVYLAGKMTGLPVKSASQWRIKAAQELGRDLDFAVLNPVQTEFTTGGIEREIVGCNKFQIRNSDVILAELDHEDVSIGTVCEIVFAHMLGKPVVVWGMAFNVVCHPWVKQHTTARFNTLEEALKYILRNYRKGGAASNELHVS